jgi:hypothetical protein
MAAAVTSPVLLAHAVHVSLQELQATCKGQRHLAQLLHRFSQCAQVSWLVAGGSACGLGLPLEDDALWGRGGAMGSGGQEAGVGSVTWLYMKAV